MDWSVWGPVLVGVAMTLLGNAAFGSYFFGQLTSAVNHLMEWKKEEAVPQLAHHADRIARIEGRLEERQRVEVPR